MPCQSGACSLCDSGLWSQISWAILLSAHIDFPVDYITSNHKRNCAPLLECQGKMNSKHFPAGSSALLYKTPEQADTVLVPSWNHRPAPRAPTTSNLSLSDSTKKFPGRSGACNPTWEMQDNQLCHGEILLCLKTF